MRRGVRRRRVFTENTPPLKEEEIPLKEETPVKEEEIPLKEETPLKEEISMKEEITVNDETSKNEEITVKDNVKDTVKDNVPLELLTDMVYLGKKANDYLSKNRITPLNDETSKNEEINVSERNSFRKLEERIEELEKNLSKANDKITELIFNSNKFLICIISCEKNREHKEWIKKTWLNSLKNHKNIDYLFIYGHPDMDAEYEINDDELHLKCDDGYFKLNEKMTCLWRYLSRVHKEYNRYLKIDDDTFVNVPKLKDYLSEIISREINYFGAYNTHVTNGSWNNLPTGLWYGPHYEGGFYGMSKEIIDYYVENITQDSIENNRCEDKLFSDTVRDKYPIKNHDISDNTICGFPNYKNYMEFKDKNKDYSNQIIIHNIKSFEDLDYISIINNKIKIFQYWGQGYDMMPSFLKVIYKHNLNICIQNNIKLILIDDNNVNDYIKPHKRFDKLAYNHKSDIIRYYILHKYGGLWFDTDVIITKDLNILYESISGYECMLDVEYDNHIGCCSLFIKKHSSVSKFCVDYINNILDNKKDIEWGEIGPLTVTALYKKHKSIILLNDYETVKDGCNFICWNQEPGINKDKWYLESESLAKSKAEKLKKNNNCYYLITWTIYRMNDMEDNLNDMVFYDKKSVFHYFINLNKSLPLIENN